jgi:succinyl-CoA synthetase alpha subunit
VWSQSQKLSLNLMESIKLNASKLAADPLSLLFQRTEPLPTLIQGITGRMGRKHAALMRAYGTQVVAGIAPAGSKSADLTDVDGVPIFSTCAQAVASTGCLASVVMVPPFEVLNAICDAVQAGVKLVVSVTEGMPAADAVRARKLVDKAGARWVGASTPGVAVPGRLKLGFIPDVSLSPGHVGVIAKSGTLSYEVNRRLVAVGLGQTVWVGVGGDGVKGTRFADVLPHFEADPQTHAVVVVGEIGGTEEEALAQAMLELSTTKPVYAVIAGSAAREGIVMGHAGAVVQGDMGTIDSKTQALTRAGAHVFNTIDGLIEAMSALRT